jgi:predicted nucleic acid-binding protein
MEQKYLIDTNIISHLFADKLPEIGKAFVANVVNTDFVISVAVEIEVLTYHESPEKMPIIEEFLQLATILPLDKEVTQKAIELRRKYKKMKLGDAIVGATAIVHSMTLMTNNTRDFANIKGLKLIDPHEI